MAGIEAVEIIPGRCEIVDEGQEFSVIVDGADTPQVRGQAVVLMVCCAVLRHGERWGTFGTKRLRAHIPQVQERCGVVSPVTFWHLAICSRRHRLY